MSEFNPFTTNRPARRYTDFVAGYISAALFTFTLFPSIKRDPTTDDLSSTTIETFKDQCNAFERNNRDFWVSEDISDFRAGQLFWFARNGHGVMWTDDVNNFTRRMLQQNSKVFGECNLIVGKDGLIEIY